MKRIILSLLLIVFAIVFVGCSDVDALGVALNQDNYENFEMTMVMDIEAPNFENTVTMKFVTDGVDTHLETFAEGMKLKMIFFERDNTYYFAIKSILLGYNTGWIVEEVNKPKT